LVPANYVYHVLNRGCHRRRLFDNTADYRFFRMLLSRARDKVGMRVCAFDVMPNHWHLVLWPERDGAVSAYVHWLCTAHVAYRVRVKGPEAGGHAYQGRFRCFPVHDAVYYYRALRYVEANALRAGLVQRAEAWKWSSAAERTHGSDLLVRGPLALPADWLELVNRGLDQDDLRALRESARSGRPYGPPGWVEETAASLGLEHTLRRPGRPPHQPESRVRVNHLEAALSSPLPLP
jgi:putative transposase